PKTFKAVGWTPVPRKIIMPKKLHGVLAIAHTPFTDSDEIDAATLKRAVDWSFDVGADGIGTGMVPIPSAPTSNDQSTTRLRVAASISSLSVNGVCAIASTPLSFFGTSLLQQKIKQEF